MKKKYKKPPIMQRRRLEQNSAPAQGNARQVSDGETRYFVHGPHELHSQQEPDGSWRTPLQDGLGSIRGVTDEMLNPLESRHYDPFGNMRDVQGTAQTLFGFTGEMVDTNELLYLRARYYNPRLGAFPNPDSIQGNVERALTLNRYSYVQNNPVNNIDPSGKICLGPLGCISEEDVETALVDIGQAVAHFPGEVVGFFGGDEAAVDQRLGNLLVPVANFWNDQFVESELSQTIRAHPVESLAVGVGVVGALAATSAVFGPAVALGAGSNIVGGLIGGRYNISSSQEILGRLAEDMIIGGAFGRLFAGIPAINISSQTIWNVVARASAGGIINMGQGLRGHLKIPVR